MKVDDLLARARDGMTVSRVFGEPHVQDGVTVIPAAVIVGGGGGGGGRDSAGNDGEGGGFGLFAAPVGAIVVKDGQVRWVPSIDLNLAVVVTGSVALAIVRRWRKRPR
jgi:uncharacterized spore protein YtfJ